MSREEILDHYRLESIEPAFSLRNGETEDFFCRPSPQKS